MFEGRNPAASPGMLPERHREAYLTAEQTLALVQALDLEPSQDAAGALVLLIVTGARRNEVLRARWENVDLGHRTLTVPRSKNGRPRQVPLSAFAARAVDRCARNSGGTLVGGGTSAHPAVITNSPPLANCIRGVR